MKATREVSFSLTYNSEEILTLYSILTKALSNNTVILDSCEDVDSFLNTLELNTLNVGENLLLVEIVNSMTKTLGESGLITLGNPDDDDGLDNP